MVELTDVSAPASEVDIQAFEARIGRQLPLRLKRHFRETNGGRPDPSRYRDEKSDLGVTECLALREGPGSVQQTYEILVRQKRFVPEHFVPFATAYCGDSFFVDCDSPSGHVYLYVHDTAHEHLQPLDITIDEFFKKLTEEE